MERVAAERRIVTVLFADLVGFTSLSEGLDPEDVATVQDAYFATVRETIGRYGGRLEKFIGDAAMAVFGIPLSRDDDAERAVRAGLALASAVEQLAARLELEPGALRVRVGVNSGEVLASPQARTDEAMVTGDAVNVAARFQSAAEPGQVLVGETTALAVADAVELEPVGSLELKGKAEPVRAWRVRGVRPERSRELAMGGLRAPLLGRDTELAQLGRALAAVGAGVSARVLTVAPPGVGKTRLVDELAGRTEGTVLRARLRPDVLTPYDAVGQLALAALARAGAAGSPGAAEPVVRERLLAGGASEARADAVGEELLTVVWPGRREDAPSERDLAEGRETRFEAWLEALDALADARSLWLVEDAHWAGPDFLAFLDAATAAPARRGRLVLATARPSLLDAAPAWCEPRDGVSVLELPPLSGATAGDLVRALVGDALPDSLVARIAERSDGNPLFIEELLRTWISVGTLVSDGEGWRLERPAEEVPLPATVQAIYGAQLDDLPPSARAVARRGSVAGRRFPLAALEPLGIDQGADGVDILRRRSLVSGPHPDALAGDAYAYRHALLRDAGYASLARAERAVLHARLARWLADSAGEHADQVAELIGRHYAQALASAPRLAREVAPGLGREDVSQLAADWFERAAETALRLSAFDAARSLLERALELTGDTLAEARRRRRLGEVKATSADMDDGARDVERALELYRHGLDAGGDARDGYAEAAATLGWIRNQQIDFEGALGLSDAALRTIGERDDLPTARLLLLRAVSVLNATEATEQPIADGERALAIVRAAGDARLELEAVQTLTQARSETTEEARDGWAEVERLALATGSWDTAVGAIRVQAALLLDDQAADALPLLDRAAELAEARGLREPRTWVEYSRTEAGLVSGAWDDAVAAAERALEIGRANAYHRAVVRTWFAVLPIAAARGDSARLEEAARWFDEFDPRPANPSPYARIVVTAARLRLAKAGLEPSFVPEVEERLASFHGGHGLPSWLAAVETVVDSWLEAGELEGAQRCLDLMRRNVEGESSLAHGTEGLLRARLLAARGDGTAAREAERALACFRTSAAPWWISKAIRLRAELGEATTAEQREAAAIERSLGVS